MSRDPESSILSGDRAGLTVGLLMAITIVAFEALAVGTVIPRAEEDLGHLELYGWVFSGFLLASVVGIAWSGEQADRYGPGRPLAIGMALFTVGLVVAGLAPTMHVLVLGRVIQGLGAGALPAIVYVVIGRGYPASLRPRMLAMLASAWVVPGFIGPAIGGAVAEWISWRATFLMIVPLLPLSALLTLPALFRLGPPPPSEAKPSRLPTAITPAPSAQAWLSRAWLPEVCCTAPPWWWSVSSLGFQRSGDCFPRVRCALAREYRRRSAATAFSIWPSSAPTHSFRIC